MGKSGDVFYGDPKEEDIGYRVGVLDALKTLPVRDRRQFSLATFSCLCQMFRGISLSVSALLLISDQERQPILVCEMFLMSEGILLRNGLERGLL
jgi:hypothetical protein